MNLSELASLFGIIFGLVGATLGSLSYFRDKSRIVVMLQWDMKALNIPRYDSNKYWGLVTITNIGRRPVYITAASLKLPKKYNAGLVLFDNSTGTSKLGEGDPPIHYIIDQESLQDYSKDWKKIRAQVYISTGKKFLSKKVSVEKIPSWVKLNKN